MNLAIVIPTMNRSELLLGQLFFYDSFGLNFKVYIGDSSQEEHKFAIRRGLKDLKNISVQFVDFPASHMQVRVIIDLLNFVQEEFVTVSGDDDYHIPSQALKCIEFLKENPSYALCTGSVAMIETVFTNGLRQAISVSDYSPEFAIVSEDPVERMRLLSKYYYLPLFCIGRTKDFIEAFHAENNITSNIIWAETLPAFKLIARGKFNILDGLAMIRGTHSLRPIYKNGLSDTFLNESWTASLHTAINTLATYLKSNGIEVTAAKKNVVDILADYYADQINRMNQSQAQAQKLSWKQRIPAPIKKILKPLYFRLNSEKLNGGSMHPYSKYYETFNKLNNCFKKAGEYLN